MIPRTSVAGCAKPRRLRTRGFSLLEVVIAVLVLAMIAGVATPRIQNRLAVARDTRRLADIVRVREAIELFHEDNGRWPAADTNASYGGWDVSHDGGFIGELVRAGYLEGPARDPRNDATYHYRYYVYPVGSYGCASEDPFYVLGVRAFETADFATRNHGVVQCSGRDWSSEFAFVVGGGAILN
ncbi:MAG: prepilin-type N-terminal cleavage/methylation domain-containing protein [Planctomycetes bacterium]|nr:prepilin-type N-terminal cleavage/methylation domain-containing protein [Planctomycetota bacterium]